jgi:hypothetical protein
MKLIDRTLARINFQTNTEWIECYLHEDEMAGHRFIVVERASVGEFGIREYDDEEKARTDYANAVKRTKARIMAHMSKITAYGD